MRAAAVVAALACPGTAAAETEGRLGMLGIGRLFTNDLMGDGHDRWRSGSVVLSFLGGPEWTGVRPAAPDAIRELRLRSEIIGPVSSTGRPGDRPYAGAVSVGLHGHWRPGDWALGATEASLGLDLTAVGPQTGVSDFQVRAHDMLSLPGPYGVRDQLDDEVHASVTAELARTTRTAPNLSLRPFVEAQYGLEDIARVGIDAMIGSVGHDDLLLRDIPNGQLYRAVPGPGPARGVAFAVGADIARVGDSVYLPRDLGYAPEPVRMRVRAGLHAQVSPGATLFYGVSWLSEEFQGQPEGQVVGSFKIDIRF